MLKLGRLRLAETWAFGGTTSLGYSAVSGLRHRLIKHESAKMLAPEDQR